MLASGLSNGHPTQNQPQISIPKRASVSSSSEANAEALPNGQRRGTTSSGGGGQAGGQPGEMIELHFTVKKNF